MASRKGKEVAGEESSGKRKRDGNEKSVGHRRRKNRGVLQFFDDAAYELEEEEEEEEESSDDCDLEDGFLQDELTTNDKGKNDFAKACQFPLFPKEEELSEEELEKMLEERYRPGASFVKYAEDAHMSKTSVEVDRVIPSSKDSTIWKIKCMVGRERHSAFCLMQKYVDLLALGTKLQIISVFALDHVKGFIYIEAERQNDVNEACKGICAIYSSRVIPVPSNEVCHLLSVRSKYNEVSVGTWARVKSGKYKGDLAQVVSVDNARKKATLKLIPRIDLQAMAEKYGGGIASKKTEKDGRIASKKTATPTPRLISSTELEEFRPLMQYRRDRDTGQAFEVLDGLMLKDGYLYKKVAIDSLNFWGLMPSEDELLKFEPCKKEEPDSQEWLTQLFGEQKKKHVRCENGGGNDKGGGKHKGGGKGEGSSSTSMSSSFEVHDLVVFGRKDFGVIVGTEKGDYFKILKEGSEGPVVVTIELRQLKNASFDKKFHALDCVRKTISVNDTVKVLEGPLQGRQGIVKQIYRGIIFFYDENEQENGGFICCKSQICEKTKLYVDASKGKGDESGFQGFEDFPSSSKSPLSPKKAWQASEKSTNFNRNDKDGMFSIGQSLRIRVGPLKGYLCRVLAVRRSDVTVKLDSQQKILTVKSEHLAEVRGKSSAISLGDDVDSAKPFDLLGTQDGSTDLMAGAGSSVEGDRWGAGGLSTERSSWPAFPSSGFSTHPGSSSANAFNSADNSSSKDVEDDGPWGTKATEKQNSSWGNHVSNEKAVEGESAWGVTAAEPKIQPGGWGSGGGNFGQSGTEASDWNKATNVDESRTENWGAGKKDGATGWGKSAVSQESSAGMGSVKSSWGKPAATELWGSKDDSNGSKAGWNNSTSAPGSETGAWGSNAGGSSWNKQDGLGSSWNKQGGGSSWAKQSDVNTEGDSKEGGFDTGCGSSGGRERGRGRGGGGNACFKCGETGHMARECTQGGGGGRGGGRSGGNACFKCGETGHMSRECPQGGGGGNVCFKCGETGHMAKECTQGGGSGGGNACFKCGETGHMARECSQGGGGARGGGGGNACFKCGETGHMARECTQDGGGGRGGGGSGGNACFKCGEMGHMARDCSQGGGGGGGGRYGGGGGGNACFKCGEMGHMARDCTQAGGDGGGGWRSGGGGSRGDSSAKATDKWGSGDGSGGSKAAWGAASWKSAQSDTEFQNQNGGWGSRGWNSAQSDTETKSLTGGWGGSSKSEPNNQTVGWGTAGGTSVQSDSEPKNHTGGWAKSSGSIAETPKLTGGWGSTGGNCQSDAEPAAQTTGWGKTGGSKAEPKNQIGGWGNTGGSMAELQKQTGGWGNAGCSKAEPKIQSGGWAAGCGVSSAELDAESINKSGVWANAGSSKTEKPSKQSEGWGIPGGNPSEPDAGLSGWGKTKNDGAIGWGKSVDPQETTVGMGSAENSWGKPAEKWSSKDDSSGSKSAWNSSTSASGCSKAEPKIQSGGWAAGYGVSSAQLDAEPINKSGVWANAGSSKTEKPSKQSEGWGISGGNSSEPDAGLSGWGKTKNDGAIGWGKSVDPQETTVGMGSAENSWGKPAEKWSSKDDSSGSKSAWNISTSASGCSKAEPKIQSRGWAAGCGGSSAQLDAEPINKSGMWANAGSSKTEKPSKQSEGWGISGGNSSEPDAGLSGWGKTKYDGAIGWGKSVDPQETTVGMGSAENSWGKPAEKWSSKDDSSGSKSAWNSSTSAAPERKTGGWGSDVGTSSWNKQDGGGGSSWGKQGGGSSWGNQSGGSSWMNTQKKENDSWSKPYSGDQRFGSSGGGRGRGGGGNACYKCGETGHMARECTQGGGGGGRGSSSGGGNACYKCGETGHMARECTQGGGGGGRGSGSGGGNACFKCGETGHMARECSQGGGGGGSIGGGGGGCYKCGEQGHFARECPNSSR